MSIGRLPISHPPGYVKIAFLYFDRIEPIINMLDRRVFVSAIITDVVFIAPEIIKFPFLKDIFLPNFSSIKVISITSR